MSATVLDFFPRGSEAARKAVLPLASHLLRRGAEPDALCRLLADLGARNAEEIVNVAQQRKDAFTDPAQHLGRDAIAACAQALGLKEHQRFRIHDEASLLERPAATFLVKDRLVAGSLVALVSDPGVGKTFLALDLALAVAAGRPTWLRQPLRASGPVLYVIAEGLGRFKYRVIAWRQRHDIDAPLPFHWIDEPVNLIDPRTSAAFVAELAPLKPSLVILDTLSRCLMGGNENDQADMGAAVAVCDEVRSRTGATVIINHHTKKDGSVERGSTVLRGAVDTLLILKEQSRGVMTLSCEKQKDAEAFEPIDLVRRGIQLDGVVEGEDGEPATSCVVELASAADREKAAPTSRILAYLRNHPGSTKNAIHDAVGGRKGDVLKEIDALVAQDAIRTKEGKLFVNDQLPY